MCGAVVPMLDASENPTDVRFDQRLISNVEQLSSIVHLPHLALPKNRTQGATAAKPHHARTVLTAPSFPQPLKVPLPAIPQPNDCSGLHSSTVQQLPNDWFQNRSGAQPKCRSRLLA